MHLVSNSNLKETITAKQKLESFGYKSFMIMTREGEKIAVINVNEQIIKKIPEILQLYSSVNPKMPYILAGREIKDTDTVIDLNYNVKIGSPYFITIAGPCSIESEDQITKIAKKIKQAGGNILRGGSFKPRSSPYAFQGMGKTGLKLLKKASEKYKLPVITEVLDTDDIETVEEYSDILQVGARNCQNYGLLKKLGKINKPVLLKRGMMTTIKEFLLSAEYILSGGNMNVILCERGIRTFETETRNTLDISAVPVLKEKTHLPVIVDPSHATGIARLVEPMSLASLAAGADGVMIEVHNAPEEALSDGDQSIKPEEFYIIMQKIKKIAESFGKRILS
ncbi:MAG: 3-deoxy-7-phosphoheptulonate synthase [Spirochaetes bacterium]|nr:3-deoxy-7-phosphoheptulonate synthase [Spirochaetota bacterium]